MAEPNSARRCSARILRGTSSGIINAGGSFGQFLFAPLLQSLIAWPLLGWQGALYALATKLGVSAYGAITGFGLIVAFTMWLIGRWYRHNCRKHGGEVRRLLSIARYDHHH